jgi:hypothetical protein
LEDDLLAGEVLELADQVTFAASLVDLGPVEVGPEISIAGLRVGEQMPHDGQDRVAHRDDRALLPAASGQAPVALAEEGVGACQCGDDLAQGGGQPRIAPAGGAASLGAGGLVVDGANLAQETRCAAVGKRPISTPISAISSWAATTPTPQIASSWATWWANGLITRLIWAVTWSIVAVVASIGFQHQLAPDAVVVVEVAGQRPCSKTASLDRMLPRASCASALGSRWPAMSAASIWRPETPKMSLITLESLIWASSSSCSSRWVSRVRSRVRLRR